MTGVITSGTTTDDSTPTFSGTAEPNATVVIYDDGVEIGRAATDASGAWTFTPSPVLVDGQHKLNYQVVDKAGNSSQKSDVIEFIVDTSKLEVSIDGATDDAGSITGAIAKGGVTDDTTPTLHGTATAGGTVKIYEGDVLLGEALVGADKKWSFTVPVALGAGPHALTATVTTVANGESERSSEFDFSIDVTPPGVPTIVQVFDDVGAPQGALSQGQSTDDTTPALSGKAEANSTVYIYDNGSLLGNAVVDALGNWSFTPSPPLLNGAHAFTVTAEDKAGNMSAASSPFAIVIDTIAPDKPVIEAVYDDHGARTGNLASGATTDDAKPTIRGSAEAGSTVIIKDGDTELGRVVAGSDGKWVFEPPAGLIDGEHKLSVEALDAAGNLSQPSDAFDVIVDTTVPTTPKITNIRDDVGEFTGILQAGGTTDDTNPTINGNGKAGEIIEIRMDGAVIGSVVVGENGRWSYTTEVAVLDGLHAFTAVAVSPGGAESAASNAYSIRVDTVAPDSPTIEAVRDNVGAWTGDLQNGQTTDDRSPTFVGKAEPNSTIIVFDGGEEVGFAAVDADGNWTYSGENLRYGEHVFTFHAFDVAGNIGVASEEWSVYVTMATRSMTDKTSSELPLSVQDLLSGDTVEFFAEGAAQPVAAAEPLSVVDLQGALEADAQDSWAVGGNQPQEAQQWNSAGALEAGYLLDQQLAG
nr:Ig-like domain-containing protein [Stenotrophomonas terrae]